ncbi:MAG: hypothetical protein FKY71_15345 [Spiribacter salinus]|uniref:Uncharacterized protein n=1 Tax=Spiribacter salinus TaxID=1335746 RepID=A0A540VN06_9GAMM|nr:MAG: hypothetical protein FKY71_15345 [Spiribacter salinus]
MSDDRDRLAARMVAEWEPLAVRTWLWLMKDRAYAEDMRQRLRSAWAERKAGNGPHLCDLCGPTDPSSVDP